MVTHDPAIHLTIVSEVRYLFGKFVKLDLIMLLLSALGLADLSFGKPPKPYRIVR